MFSGSKKRRILLSVTAILLCAAFGGTVLSRGDVFTASADGTSYIKWVDFGVSAQALTDAMRLDIESHGGETPLSWIDLLAALAAKTGGNFRAYRKSALDAVADALRADPHAYDETKYFSYYREAFGAVLGGMIGDYTVYEKTDAGYRAVSRYGLKAFSPIARGFSYSDYDDFGAARSYGYRREHLGHDLLGSIGTPLIAVESGYVEALGWNAYGGWRIGIRSFDGKRYYYYAHLRKDHPYAADLAEGDVVTAGEVIGYLGMTGYSQKENVNGIEVPHLHFGLQLIFHPDQKDGMNQIWINCYALCRFLAQNKSAVYRDGTEWRAVNPIADFTLPD